MKDPMKKGKKFPEKKATQAHNGAYLAPILEVKKLSQIVTLTSY